MSSPIIMTYSDAYSHCLRFLEGRGPAPRSVICGAIRAAYQTVMDAHDWPALTRNHRIQLKASVTTGTITYDKTGGSSERLLTFSSEVVPTDAADYSVRIDDVVCDIEQYLSSTTVKLDSVMCPGADVDEGTSYTLYKRWYALPSDFIGMTNPVSENSALGREVSMTEMLHKDRLSPSSGHVSCYAVGERPDVYGGLKALFVWPAVSSDATLDIIINRQARTLRHSGHAAGDYAGTVTVSAGSANVTGNSSTFVSSMEGAILRFGTTSVRPDWEYGDNMFKEQRSIRTVSSADGAAAIVLDAVTSLAHSTVRYRITDPVDLAPQAHNAFLRYCEYNLGVARNLGGTREMKLDAEDTLIAAMGAVVTSRFDPAENAGLHLFPGTIPAGVWDETA